MVEWFTCILIDTGKVLFAQHNEIVNPLLNRGLPPDCAAGEPNIDFGLKSSDLACAAYLSGTYTVVNCLHTDIVLKQNWDLSLVHFCPSLIRLSITTSLSIRWLLHPLVTRRRVSSFFNRYLSGTYSTRRLVKNLSSSLLHTCSQFVKPSIFAKWTLGISLNFKNWWTRLYNFYSLHSTRMCLTKWSLIFGLEFVSNSAGPRLWSVRSALRLFSVPLWATYIVYWSHPPTQALTRSPPLQPNGRDKFLSRPRSYFWWNDWCIVLPEGALSTASVLAIKSFTGSLGTCSRSVIS